MQSYAEVFSWMFLAIGGAMFLGTAAALLRYRRTGRFPGQGVDEPASAARVRGVVIRLVAGVLLLGWGSAALLMVTA